MGGLVNLPFHLWLMLPDSAHGRALADVCGRAGRTVILDVASGRPGELPPWPGIAGRFAEAWPTGFGLRASLAQAAEAGRRGLLARARILVLAGDEPAGDAAAFAAPWRERGVTVCREYAPLSDAGSAADGFDAVVVRGHESGGRSRAYSVRTLFEGARRFAGNLPLLVQGAEAPAPAAVFIALGAGGIVLDASPFFLPCAEMEPGCMERLRIAGEAALRLEPRPGDWVDVACRMPAASGEIRLPLGADALLCEQAWRPANPFAAAGMPDRPEAALSPPRTPIELEARFRQGVNAALDRLRRLSASDLDGHCGEPFAIQGPMAYVTNCAAFSAASARAGFFPVLATTGLDEAGAGKLADELLRESEPGAYALGMAGAQNFDAAALIARLAPRPPAALVLAVDQWPHRGRWRAFGAPLWLHAQRFEQVEAGTAEGFRTFILEGGESGGHVGSLPSSVLWPRLFWKTVRAGLDTGAHQWILAGGVDGAESVLFGLLLAQAIGLAGRFSFQVGTPLLLTDEAVDTGAISRMYRDALAAARRTRVLGAGGGSGLRVACPDSDTHEGPAADTPEAGARALAAYRGALRGEPGGLALAGEGILKFDRPVSLRARRAAFDGFGALGAERLAALCPVSAPDFRATGPAPRLDLAVVGVGGIFPGAPDWRQYWLNIAANRRCIAEVPPGYWGPGDYMEAGRPGDNAFKSYCRHAGMIDFFTFDAFDCLKFHISPRAAGAADKIHLMTLKAVDQAAESAGAAFAFPGDRTAVLIANSMGGESVRRGTIRTHVEDVMAVLGEAPAFARLAPDERADIGRRLRERLGERAPPSTEDSMVGNLVGILTGKVASYLGLRGGHFSVDAACASSLAALMAAVSFIESGQIDAAVVGGVDSDLSADLFIGFCRLRALSRTISRPYMAGSDGFTMGEGCGVLFLKPLDQALRDGDRIYARIVGIGMSSDGREGSLTLPSAEGQWLALRRCFESSGFDPESIGYVEGHGTGTAAGDAVELDVLARAFAGARPGQVALGSVKAHIGHLKSASGIASLLKAALALHHGRIPPAWIEGEPHPDLRKPCSRLRLPAADEPWAGEGLLPRRAAVSAFGFGGGNFHVHLEEMSEAFRHLSASRLLFFAGPDRAALADRVERLAAAAARAGVFDWADPAQVECLGGAGACRLAAVWDTRRPWAGAIAALKDAAAGRAAPGTRLADSAPVRKVAFLFPGQGSAGRGSFLQFRETVPVFAHAIAAAGQRARSDYASRLWPGPDTAGALSRDPVLQPATVALSLALARLWLKLGIRPDAVAGHSLGFYSALAAAGALSEADTLELVARRAKCFDALAPEAAGCLVALSAGEDAVRELAARSPVTLHVSNVNSPCQTVVALKTADLQAALRFFESSGAGSRLVPTGWAFHSPLVRPAAEAFGRHLGSVRFHAPFRTIYSELNGLQIPATELDGRYPGWLPGHILAPIRFPDLVRALQADGVSVFLELGAGGTLTRFVRDSVAPAPVDAFTSDSTQPDLLAHWHETLAFLFVEAGCALDAGAYADAFAGQLRPVRIGIGGVGVPAAPAEGRSAPAAVAPIKPDDTQRDGIYLKVRSIVARHTGFDERMIPFDRPLFETLGLDSLKMMSIAMDFEREFRRPVLDGALPRELTLEGLSDHVRMRMSDPALSKAAPLRLGRYRLVRREAPLPLEGERSLNESRMTGRAAGRGGLPAAAGGSAPLPGEAGHDSFGLLTNDEALSEAWSAANRGPAALAAQPGAAGSLLESAPAGLVVALRASHGGEPERLRQSCGLLLDVARVLAARPPGAAAPRLLAAGYGRVGPIEEGMCAFMKSLQRERTAWQCGFVSVAGRLPAPAIAGILWRELTAPAHPFAFAHHVKSRRWIDHLEPDESDAGAMAPALRSDDVVLVTGGGRGITAAAISGLSKAAQPVWILVGSTSLETDSPAAREINRTIENLKAQGCRVEYRRCDLADPLAVRALSAWVREKHPDLTGVMHGAGALADARVENKDRAAFERVLAIKAGAALELEQTLPVERLRFWVNFSSLASFLGNEGQTDYAAANAVLNAQAARLLARGVPMARSLLWSAWSGVGMASSGPVQAALRSQGVAAIDPETGVRLLCRELESGNGPAVVAFCGDPSTPALRLPGGGLWPERRVSGAKAVSVSEAFTTDDPFLRDHVIRGMSVTPGVMALEWTAAELAGNRFPIAWEDVAFHRIMCPADGRLVVALAWEACSANMARFALSEAASGTAPAITGVLRPRHYRRRAAAQPEAGALMETLPESGLYGSEGLLFSGQLFQVLRGGVRCYEHRIESNLARFDAAAYCAPGRIARLPFAWADALMQLAAIRLLRAGAGPHLPSGFDFAWWSGKMEWQPEMIGCVWPVPGGRSGEARFDGAVTIAGQTIWLVKGLRMKTLKGEQEP